MVVKKKASVLKSSVARGVLMLNVPLHFGTGAFTGLTVANLVAPSGGLNFMNWVEVGLSVMAVGAGLSYLSYQILNYVPQLPPARRKWGTAGLLAVYGGVALTLSVATASVLGSAAGEVAHMEASLAAIKVDAEERRRAHAMIIDRRVALDECVDTGLLMSEQERLTGAFSRQGGDVGRVAVSLRNISVGCATARDALLVSRARMARLFWSIDRLLTDMRRTINGDLERSAKMARLRQQADEYQKLTRAVNDAMADDALRSVAAALSKDWLAAGLPELGAAAIAQNFGGLGEALTDDLDDVAHLKEKPIPNVPAVSNMTYLGMYPAATIAALAIAACFELIPLCALILGLAIMTQRPK